MKYQVRTPRVLQFLLTGLLAAAATALADPAAECRQEVQEYAIPPEQAAEYIEGCILSRGGLPDPVADEAPAPAVDEGYDPPAETEPMYDTGQADEALPGDIYGTN